MEKYTPLTQYFDDGNKVSADSKKCNFEEVQHEMVEEVTVTNVIFIVFCCNMQVEYMLKGNLSWKL